jgi:predicted membrane metal-binding protein
MEGNVSAGLTIVMNQTSGIPTNPRELRQFGLLFSAILVALFGVLLPWLLGHTFPPWPWAIAAILSAIALILPRALTPFYRAWMRFGLIAGYINTHIIMFMLYYLVFAPLGIIMSLVGRDALLRKTGDTTQDSYRVTSSQREADHFERPY